MIQFGTGGWRAVIGDEFCKANVQLLSAAVAQMLKDEHLEGKGFIIGYDRRFLSEEAVRWVAEVMAGCNVPCQVIKRESPTPLIMYAIEQSHAPYGMAITASHNPAIYNGIKMFMAGGRDADEVLTSRIEEYISRTKPADIHSMPYDNALASGMVKLINPMNDYIDAVLSAVNTRQIRQSELKIALDPMYGVSKTAFKTILYTMRCEVETIHERRDALFGGRMPAPNKETLAELINFVDEQHCDIGIATDGDADRLGVVNDKAEFLPFNNILVLLYYYLLEYKGLRGPVVRNIATTHMLDRVAAAYGEVCYEVPVGFKHISAAMETYKAILGGESSGGLTVQGHIQGKDGIYSGTLLIEMVAVSGKKLSQLWQEIESKFGTGYMAEADYQFDEATKTRIQHTLMQAKEVPDFGYPIAKVNYVDGCKIYFENGGWIIARFSGTEPLLRIFAEMGTQKQAISIIQCWEKALGI